MGHIHMPGPPGAQAPDERVGGAWAAGFLLLAAARAIDAQCHEARRHRASEIAARVIYVEHGAYTHAWASRGAAAGRNGGRCVGSRLPVACRGPSHWRAAPRSATAANSNSKRIYEILMIGQKLNLSTNSHSSVAPGAGGERGPAANSNSKRIYEILMIGEGAQFEHHLPLKCRPRRWGRARPGGQ